MKVYIYLLIVLLSFALWVYSDDDAGPRLSFNFPEQLTQGSYGFFQIHTTQDLTTRDRFLLSLKTSDGASLKLPSLSLSQQQINIDYPIIPIPIWAAYQFESDTALANEFMIYSTRIAQRKRVLDEIASKLDDPNLSDGARFVLLGQFRTVESAMKPMIPTALSSFLYRSSIRQYTSSTLSSPLSPELSSSTTSTSTSTSTSNSSFNTRRIRCYRHPVYSGPLSTSLVDSIVDEPTYDGDYTRIKPVSTGGWVMPNNQQYQNMEYSTALSPNHIISSTSTSTSSSSSSSSTTSTSHSNGSSYVQSINNILGSTTSPRVEYVAGLRWVNATYINDNNNNTNNQEGVGSPELEEITGPVLEFRLTSASTIPAGTTLTCLTGVGISSQSLSQPLTVSLALYQNMIPSQLPSTDDESGSDDDDKGSDTEEFDTDYWGGGWGNDDENQEGSGQHDGDSQQSAAALRVSSLPLSSYDSNQSKRSNKLTKLSKVSSRREIIKQDAAASAGGGGSGSAQSSPLNQSDQSATGLNITYKRVIPLKEKSKNPIHIAIMQVDDDEPIKSDSNQDEPENVDDGNGGDGDGSTPSNPDDEEPIDDNGDDDTEIIEPEPVFPPQAWNVDTNTTLAISPPMVDFAIIGLREIADIETKRGNKGKDLLSQLASKKEEKEQENEGWLAWLTGRESTGDMAFTAATLARNPSISLDFRVLSLPALTMVPIDIKLVLAYPNSTFQLDQSTQFPLLVVETDSMNKMYTPDESTENIVSLSTKEKKKENAQFVSRFDLNNDITTENAPVDKIKTVNAVDLWAGANDLLAIDSDIMHTRPQWVCSNRQTRLIALPISETGEILQRDDPRTVRYSYYLYSQVNINTPLNHLVTARNRSQGSSWSLPHTPVMGANETPPLCSLRIDVGSHNDMVRHVLAIQEASEIMMNVQPQLQLRIGSVSRVFDPTVISPILPPVHLLEPHFSLTCSTFPLPATYSDETSSSSSSTAYSSALSSLFFQVVCRGLFNPHLLSPTAPGCTLSQRSMDNCRNSYAISFQSNFDIEGTDTALSTPSFLSRITLLTDPTPRSLPKSSKHTYELLFGRLESSMGLVGSLESTASQSSSSTTPLSGAFARPFLIDRDKRIILINDKQVADKGSFVVSFILNMDGMGAVSPGPSTSTLNHLEYNDDDKDDNDDVQGYRDDKDESKPLLMKSDTGETEQGTLSSPIRNLAVKAVMATPSQDSWSTVESPDVERYQEDIEGQTDQMGEKDNTISVTPLTDSNTIPPPPPTMINPATLFFPNPDMYFSLTSTLMVSSSLDANRDYIPAAAPSKQPLVFRPPIVARHIKSYCNQSKTGFSLVLTTVNNLPMPSSSKHSVRLSLVPPQTVESFRSVSLFNLQCWYSIQSVSPASTPLEINVWEGRHEMTATTDPYLTFHQEWTTLLTPDETRFKNGRYMWDGGDNGLQSRAASGDIRIAKSLSSAQANFYSDLKSLADLYTHPGLYVFCEWDTTLSSDRSYTIPLSITVNRQIVSGVRDITYTRDQCGLTSKLPTVSSLTTKLKAIQLAQESGDDDEVKKAASELLPLSSSDSNTKQGALSSPSSTQDSTTTVTKPAWVKALLSTVPTPSSSLEDTWYSFRAFLSPLHDVITPDEYIRLSRHVATLIIEAASTDPDRPQNCYSLLYNALQFSDPLDLPWVMGEIVRNADVSPLIDMTTLLAPALIVKNSNTESEWSALSGTQTSTQFFNSYKLNDLPLPPLLSTLFPGQGIDATGLRLSYFTLHIKPSVLFKNSTLNSDNPQQDDIQGGDDLSTLLTLQQWNTCQLSPSMLAYDITGLEKQKLEATTYQLSLQTKLEREQALKAQKVRDPRSIDYSIGTSATISRQDAMIVDGLTSSLLEDDVSTDTISIVESEEDSKEVETATRTDPLLSGQTWSRPYVDVIWDTTMTWLDPSTLAPPPLIMLPSTKLAVGSQELHLSSIISIQDGTANMRRYDMTLSSNSTKSSILSSSTSSADDLDDNTSNALQAYMSQSSSKNPYDEMIEIWSSIENQDTNNNEWHSLSLNSASAHTHHIMAATPSIPKVNVTKLRQDGDEWVANTRKPILQPLPSNYQPPRPSNVTVPMSFDHLKEVQAYISSIQSSMDTLSNDNAYNHVTLSSVLPPASCRIHPLYILKAQNEDGINGLHHSYTDLYGCPSYRFPGQSCISTRECIYAGNEAPFRPSLLGPLQTLTSSGSEPLSLLPRTACIAYTCRIISPQHRLLVNTLQPALTQSEAQREANDVSGAVHPFLSFGDIGRSNMLAYYIDVIRSQYGLFFLALFYAICIQFIIVWCYYQ